jgi:hypothetical protein
MPVEQTYNSRMTRAQGTAQDPSDLGARKCSREETAYRTWLGILGPLRWICLGGGVILSAAAGMSVLGESAFFGPNWKLVSTLFAFTASALTGLHGVLKCDSHQSECHRLIQAFRGLRFEYEASKDLGPQERSKRREELDAKFARLVTTAAATPAGWCYKKADREVN